MSLVNFAGRLLIAVVALLVATAIICLDRRQLARTLGTFRARLREVAPHVGLLVGILVVNKVVREAGPTVSWVFELNVSGLIYSIEGDFVRVVQTVQHPVLTAFFSFMYLAGYITLLVFPFVAYFALEDRRFLKQAALAYAANYAIGLVFYVLFVSYGPRNVIPDVVNQPLYSTYPEAQIFTGHLNANTNVFPSLHASLAITVALLAVRTRHRYPRWTAIATLAAASIVLSTLYLGIHWATDVVAGAVLAGWSVWFADRWWNRRVDTDRRKRFRWPTGLNERGPGPADEDHGIPAPKRSPSQQGSVSVADRPDELQ